MQPRAAVWIVVLLAAACAEAPRVELLSDLPAFDGWVRIEARIGAQARAIEGTLRFERSTGALTFARAVGGATVVLTRAAGGGLARTVDGQPAAVAPEDEEVFVLLMSVLVAAPDPGAEVRRLDDGYAIVGEAQELRVHHRAGASGPG